MNISVYIDEYASKKRYHGLSCRVQTVHSLIIGDANYSLKSQKDYTNSDCLAENIELSVRGCTQNKDIAIEIYKDFCKFLKGKGIEIIVNFPHISIANSFERLMFIAKYLQDPQHKVSELENLLWVSDRTIQTDLAKLRGIDGDPIQICGKVFKIDETTRGRNVVRFSSTVHPLFLAPNLTQVIVTLKGLKAMSDDARYTEYARLIATDIWEQLSDYAKTRIHFVLSELLPDDLTWYESLQKHDDNLFYPEHLCSKTDANPLDCYKNNKMFYVKYDSGQEICFYRNCVCVRGSMDNEGFEVTCDQGKVRLHFNRILYCSYTAEEMLKDEAGLH